MKTEVTMLPNTSRATMPPAAHPANDAEPRIAAASVRLRRLHARTSTGVSAKLFEMRAADRNRVELPSDTMRLLIVLNEVGGRAELRTSPGQEIPTDYPGPNHISLVPERLCTWPRVERMGYCRHRLVHFDADRLWSGKLERPEFLPRLMFSNATIWRYGQLIAEECARPGALSDAYGESLSLAFFLYLVRLNGGLGARNLSEPTGTLAAEKGDQFHVRQPGRDAAGVRAGGDQRPVSWAFQPRLQGFDRTAAASLASQHADPPGPHVAGRPKFIAGRGCLRHGICRPEPFYTDVLQNRRHEPRRLAAWAEGLG
jgi:hypothetical protein